MHACSPATAEIGSVRGHYGGALPPGLTQVKRSIECAVSAFGRKFDPESAALARRAAAADRAALRLGEPARQSEADAEGLGAASARVEAVKGLEQRFLL